MHEILLAYAAGLLDGEGHITIGRFQPNKWTGRPRHWIVVIVGNTDKKMTDLLQKHWPGPVHIRKRPPWRDCYVWQISCMKAYQFLKEVRPYLVCKAEEADVAIEFMENRPTARKKHGRVRYLTDAEVVRREELYQEMKALKAPPATTERAAPIAENRVKRQSALTGIGTVS